VSLRSGSTTSGASPYKHPSATLRRGLRSCCLTLAARKPNSYAREPRGINYGAENKKHLFMIRSPRAQSELSFCQDRLVTSFRRRNGAAMVPQFAPPGLHPLVRARMTNTILPCRLSATLGSARLPQMPRHKAQPRASVRDSTSTRKLPELGVQAAWLLSLRQSAEVLQGDPSPSLIQSLCRKPWLSEVGRGTIE